MEEQALPVRHIGIDFQLPAIRAERIGNAGGECRLQGALHPLTATFHERIQTRPALLVAWGALRSSVSTEPEHFLVHDQVDVLGETLDELPRLRERRASLEYFVRLHVGFV